MSDKKKPSAVERTLNIFSGLTQAEMEAFAAEEQGKIEAHKVRDPYDPDKVLALIIQEESERDSYNIRIAKFVNGKRGLQLMRGDAFASTLILKADEYHALAVCILRDSTLIKRLLLSFAPGTNELVDALRDIVRKH